MPCGGGVGGVGVAGLQEHGCENPYMKSAETFLKDYKKVVDYMSAHKTGATQTKKSIGAKGKGATSRTKHGGGAPKSKSKVAKKKRR